MSGYIRVFEDDCRNVLRTVPDNSIDSVVTDPPYALVSIVKRFGKTSIDDANDTGERSKSGADGYARLARGFMGKKWDNGEVAFSVEFWAEVLRVLKPGGHVLAFGGTRSYHRLACAIEDAGFEVRDQLAWTYGQGFPKSLDVSKAIDKAAGAEREVIGRHIQSHNQRNMNTAVNHAMQWAHDITAPATDAARQWEGWGSNLKPSWEPICLARKPLSEKTIAANVLRWGCGALNIDACRIEAPDKTWGSGNRDSFREMEGRSDRQTERYGEADKNPGLRWPANLAHDGSQEVLDLFPKTAKSSGHPRNNGEFKSIAKGQETAHVTYGHDDNGGSAARFFFCAKASKADRVGSKHPTVKPVKLMQWLCRMVTPPGGTILDPFAGSGTTGAAALLEGFDAVLIEREKDYFADLCQRVGLEV